MPDFVTDNLNGAEFEASVRQVARQLYSQAKSAGSTTLEGRERDEIIDTGTELIVVEATQSRKLDKIRVDLAKSVDLVKQLRRSPQYSEYNFRIMIVTSNDPTADQNAHVKSVKAGCPKEVISFTTLFSRLFDARHYIRVRSDHSFGSVRDPANEANHMVPPSDYIATALSRESTGESIKASELADRLAGGGRYVIYGDYGSGKSMTLRDIYFKARDQFVSGKSLRCPIYLNLREHIAQTEPDEALYRHTDKIGFSNPHSLIAAWRAGFITLFLDGFDELTPPQFASSVSNLRQARRLAVEIVKRFVAQTPQCAPIIIAGRESYFDSREEAQNALGYDATTQVFDLAGFTDTDIRRFLKAKKTQLPSWLPTRPLLLGYLANAGLLKGPDQPLSLDPAIGWDQIIHRVCEREVSQVWGVGFEPSDLRLFIEGLATCARKSQNGRGLEDSDLQSVFRRVFGRDADAPANLLTRRLPGLGSVPGRPSAREFIDADFADAAASGDLGRFIKDPFAERTHLEHISATLSELGRSMASATVPVNDLSAKISIALNQSGPYAKLATTSEDLMAILVDGQADYKGAQLTILDANFEKIVVESGLDFSAITFSQCIIRTIELGRSMITTDPQRYPNFHDCVIECIEGAVSKNDIPDGVLSGSTSVENYAAFTPTNDAVLRSALADPVKVLLTILRKLFMQRGTGRQYSALRRGLPNSLVKYVDPIIAHIKTEAFAQDIFLDRRTILIPYRSRSADALAIINGPNMSVDPLMEKVRRM